MPLQLAERGCVSPTPLVIADGPAQRPLVVCANAAARGAGIREGQAVASAKALAHELKVLPRDASAEVAALEGLAGWACQYSPHSSVDAQGIAMEVEGSLRLFGGHAKLTAEILRGVRDLGYQVTMGIAPTPLAARLFARAEALGTRMRACFDLAELPGRVAGLPLFLLDWPERTLALLADLGVLRMRDALALPREGLSRRFGPDALDTLDKLLGRRADPRPPYIAPQAFHAKIELAAETSSTEALLFPLKRMLVQMEGFLRGRGSGVQQLEITLTPVRKAATRLSLEFASAEREADFILALVREKLGRTRLAAPTLEIELHAACLLSYALRTKAWLPGRDDMALDRNRLLERLAARLGTDRVFGIAIADDHRPERNRGVRPLYSAKQIEWSDPSIRPLWLMHTPQKLVTQEGKPALQGALELVAGPERIEAGWWDGEPVSRDYFVASNPGGERYWIYREHRAPNAWYVHGVFA
ncbi:Protein ImuB [Usitatibacter palustris]|uniref:Protein ImuB n=1 Tax=Usitatibacter palustris TaxID=2732487 RepID=A0A6M4H6G5_9PROT|nr:Protein ImuB [Usitatibacter palustris]